MWLGYETVVFSNNHTCTGFLDFSDTRVMISVAAGTPVIVILLLVIVCFICCCVCSKFKKRRKARKVSLHAR